MNRFFLFFLPLFIFTGCNSQPEESVADPADTPPAVSTLGIPLPSAEMLAALGSENDIPIRNLLPDAIFAIVGKPKQFLASPLGIGNEPLLSTIIAQGMQLYRFDLSHIDRFVQTSSLPMPVAINVPNPQDPNALPQQRVLQIARRATVLTFDSPIEKTTLFTTILNIDPAFLETRKRTEGKYEYYDLTPPDIVVPQKLAVGLLDDRNVIFIEGLETDVKAGFAGAIPKNAVLDRLKHTPLAENELTILTSLEGQNISPQMLEMMTSQLGEAGYVPQNMVTIISQHLRSLSLSLKVSAPAGQPVISIAAEGRDEKSAEVINDAIQGLIVHGQTTMLAMNEETKKAFPIPSDFALSLLNAMAVNRQETQVLAVLNNFDALISTVSAEINKRQILFQQQQLLQQRAEQLMMYTELCAAYYETNKKFPADITDAEGKPLLSWRVALLPMLGMEDLYKKFKLDEPWDSANNKELLNSMPMVFHPLIQEVAPPKTVVRFFDSAGTPLSNKDLKVEDIKNPQTTLFFAAVSPQYAVEWTKPDSLVFDIDKIGETVGDVLFGVTFSGQVHRIALLPPTDPQYARQRQEIEAMIKGLSIEPPQTPNPPAPVGPPSVE